MDKWSPLVSQAANSSGGVVLTGDLAAAGLSTEEIRAATHGLFRLRRGAYSLTPPGDEAQNHLLTARAVVAQHRSAVALSHTSAAQLHGLPVAERHLATIHLTGPPGEVRAGTRHGVHTHAAELAPGGVGEVDGLPVTAVLRTALDCLVHLAPDEALVLADYALNRRLVDSAQLRAAADSLPRGPGVTTARRVAHLADGRSESPGESHTRLILLQAGWEVQPQSVICDSDGRFLARVDFLLTGWPIVVEFDGRAKYGMDGDVAAAHWQEKQRQDQLHDAGYLVVRVIWRDLHDPGIIVRKVAAAASRARRMGLAG